MPHKIAAYIFSMRDAAAGIIEFVEGKTVEDLKNDLMLRSAVERQFEIIGEAMTRLRAAEPEAAKRISEYQGIIQFRNVLIHGYDTIDHDIMWRIIHEKLPILIDELEALLKSL